MTVINLFTNDQELLASERPKVATGNANTVRVNIDFDSKWDDFPTRYATFRTSTDGTSTVYRKILTDGTHCLVPPEVLTRSGYIYIGVCSVQTIGVAKISMEIRYKIGVGAGGIIASCEPTPDLYHQILAAYGVLNAKVDNIATLAEGSTTGDAELINARIGYDGTKYASLQQAIAQQICGRINYKVNGYVYPPRGADLDIVANDDGSVTVTIYADSLTAITPGSSEYGGVAITATEILTQLPGKVVLNEDEHLEFTVPEYNALCFNASSGLLTIKSIRTIANDDKVLLYNSWGNACGGSFMDFYNRKEHGEIIKFIGLQKSFVYVGSDGRVTIDRNPSDGTTSITLENGITYYPADSDDSLSSISFTTEDIATQLGSRAVLSDDGTLVIKLNTYQALCLDFKNETLVVRHIRHVKPNDIVLLYNSWANIQGLLLNKAMEHDIRDLKAGLGSINAFNSGDISYGINTTQKCTEYADLFNDSAETESFLFFTDPHLLEKGEDYEANLKKYIVTLEKYYKSTPTSFVLCGGDWLGNSDTPAEAKYKLGYIDGFMKGMFDKYYSILGNHDTNYQGKDEAGNTHAGILENQTITNLWYREYGKNYYTFDGNNTRFYVLDSGTDWDNTLTKYRASQIGWLADRLKSEDKTHSAIAMHIYFVNDVGAVSVFGAEVGELITAYHNRETITTPDGTTHDFSSCHGHVEFIITGHTHADMTGYAGTNTPVICTLNTRSGDTPSFDLVYADYSNRLVKLVRVGTGSNRVIELAT